MSIQWSGPGLSSEYSCMRRSFQWNSYRRYKHVNRPWYQPCCRSFRRGLPRLRLPIGKWTSMDQSRDKFITHLECKCYHSQGDLDRWMKLLLSFRLMRAPQIWDSSLRTSLIFRAFETTMSREWINRTQAGESLLQSSLDNDSIIFVIWLREYNDCKSRARGPAEKVTVAATFKHRVIFADTRDLRGSWRSICTSIDDLFSEWYSTGYLERYTHSDAWECPKNHE